jgi:hypothetical protein
MMTDLARRIGRLAGRAEQAVHNLKLAPECLEGHPNNAR